MLALRPSIFTGGCALNLISLVLASIVINGIIFAKFSLSFLALFDSEKASVKRFLTCYTEVKILLFLNFSLIKDGIFSIISPILMQS